MLKNLESLNLIFIVVVLLLTTTFEMGKIGLRFAEAGKRSIHITDDLDDVVDDEEDEVWKEWGKKKSPDLPDPSKLSIQEMQAHMMKQQTGPVFGFAKLRPGFKRTRDEVTEIAMKWKKLARTGAVEAKFMGFDLGTIMVTLERGQDAEELQEFLLSQEDAYEIKIGERVYRREGDPPLEEVMEKLRSEKSQAEQTSSNKENRHQEL